MDGYDNQIGDNNQNSIGIATYNPVIHGPKDELELF